MPDLTPLADASTRTAPLAEPRRPVAAYSTGEGVIVLSNRPASSGEHATPTAPASSGAPSTPPAAASVTTRSNEPSPSGRGRAPDDASAAALWGGVAMILLILLAAALVARERRRRAAAHYAALLAHSQPRPSPPDASAEAGPPSAPSGPASSRVELHPAAPASGVSTPTPSERQWLSQPPPRGPKDPGV